MDIVFSNHLIKLLPSGALVFPRQHALVLADLHLGKMLALQDMGIPGHAFADLPTIQKLKKDIVQFKVKKIILLGDIFHQNSHHMQQLVSWFFEMLLALVPEVIVTLGNHDKGLLEVKNSFGLRCVNAYDWAGIHFVHQPVTGTFCMAGHIHPGIKLKKGKLTKACKAFLINNQQLILPAYGVHTGVSPVNYPYCQAYVIQKDNVFLDCCI